MNYIRHLSAFYARLPHDPSLTALHISLYMALFQQWNLHWFQTPFPVRRNELMRLSRIGSKNTYHKCLQHLHQHGYISYQPGARYQPVRITMHPLHAPPAGTAFGSQPGQPPPSPQVIIGTLPAQPMTLARTTAGTPPVPHSVRTILKHINTQTCVSKQAHTPATVTEQQRPERSQTAAAAGPLLTPVPSLAEVQDCFLRFGYPTPEAGKFYHYYQSIGWRLSGHIPIVDWQAIAHKWMLNPSFPTTKTFTHAPGTTAHTRYDQPL